MRLNEQRQTVDTQQKTAGLNIVAIIVHLCPILLLSTGIFEFYSAFKQSEQLNDWIFRATTIEIILRSIVDLMICAVFWILTDNFKKISDKIKAHSSSLTEEGLQSSRSSVHSFPDFMSQESYKEDDTGNLILFIKHGNSYNDLITSQFELKLVYFLTLHTTKKFR